MAEYQASRHYLAGSGGELSITPTPDYVRQERNVMVPMRDGVRLAANLYLPQQEGRYPLVLSTSPYGKDLTDAALRNQLIPDFHTGTYATSDSTTFEAPDPAYWVKQGYAVMHVDTRGMGLSEGDSAPFSPIAGQDYFDVIEWAGTQNWCDGNVGTCGVSYLAWSQWQVAALRPPHLKAIIPFEGFHSLYDFYYSGGIPERGMGGLVYSGWIDPMRRAGSTPDPDDGPAAALAHPLQDDYWRARTVDLENIEVPALICGSFSDQGLHTPDSFHGYRRIGSLQKWLYTHRRLKWEAFYAAQDVQCRFFDHFLKGIDTGLLAEPRVHLEVYTDRITYKTLSVEQWPAENTSYQTLYLDAGANCLSVALPEAGASASYSPNDGGSVMFDHVFDADTDIVGHGALRLWVSTSEGDDIDLFIGLQKFDSDGDQVFFYGNTGSNANDMVSRGWLRVSHRELDAERSLPWLPVLRHDSEQKLASNEIVPVNIEIIPSATTFLKGERLRLIIQGNTIVPGAPWADFDTINRGQTNVFTGGGYDSHLLLPILSES